MKKRYKDIMGERFGKLVAIEYTNMRKGTSVVWKCICDCGKIHYASHNNLCHGKTKSCGCLRSKKRTRIYSDYFMDCCSRYNSNPYSIYSNSELDTYTYEDQLFAFSGKILRLSGVAV